MTEAEKISGKNRFTVFRQLEKDRTLIRMHLLGKQYERLTVVTGIREYKKDPFFLIDCPQDFKSVTADDDDCRLRFEFTGKDNLKYSFRTSGKAFVKNEICIKFPKEIERIQRRRDFRLAPPLGTRIYINAKPAVREMTVLDISQGGALGAIAKQNKPVSEDPLFKVGNRLLDFELVIPAETETIMIQIKEAVIKRLGKHVTTGRDTCAVQFTDIEKEPKRILTELIYRFQRDILRSRLADN